MVREKTYCKGLNSTILASLFAILTQVYKKTAMGSHNGLVEISGFETKGNILKGDITRSTGCPSASPMPIMQQGTNGSGSYGTMWSLFV